MIFKYLEVFNFYITIFNYLLFMNFSLYFKLTNDLTIQKYFNLFNLF